MDVFVVLTSFTNNLKEFVCECSLSSLLCTKISGSCSFARNTQAIKAGIMPTINIPRHPIIGMSNGVNKAAANTPNCQPKAT